jgi:hypothetical protein
MRYSDGVSPLSGAAKLNRRRFLLTAGGVSLALPLLHALGAPAQSEAFPKRLILLYNPNGTVHDGWWPTDVISETEFTLGEIHQPLSSFRNRLLIVRGIDLASAAAGPGGPHQRGIGTLFTGQTLQEGDFVDGCGSRAGWANGISVDQEVAKHIGTVTPFGSLELGVRATQADVQGRISYAGPGQPLPPMNSPLDVFKRLFSNFSPEATDNEIDPLHQRRQSVIDAVKAQFNLVRQRTGADDREKLDRHLELIRDVERRLNAGVSGSCFMPDAPPDLAPDDEQTMPEITRLQLDLLALALACDMTRVASVQISTALNRIRFSWLNSLEEGHALSHSPDSDAKAQAGLALRARWHAEQLAYLMDRLAAIPEGDGSVLDNTLIVWGNEVSRGNSHTHQTMPFLLAGGAGGYFRMGRYIELSTATSHCNLLVSILNAMGVETDTFGLPEYCTGAISELTA